MYTTNVIHTVPESTVARCSSRLMLHTCTTCSSSSGHSTSAAIIASGLHYCTTRVVQRLSNAGLPYALDANTLETVGIDTLGGSVRPGLAVSIEGVSEEVQKRLGVGGSCHTAHPHYDPVRDVLVSWSWSALQKQKGPQSTILTFWEWDKQFNKLVSHSSTDPFL
jgi:Retinal pigment epithelial membrane protein